LLTLTEIILFYNKLTSLMITAVIWYCVFNFTCTSGICIQRDIIGNLFYSTFTNVFYSCHVFYVF